MYEPALYIRKPIESDIDSLAKLIKRFYLFNEEFDPAWATVENIDEASIDRAKRYLEGEGLTLVAVCDNDLIGYLHAEIKENPLLATGKIGVITELYVIPSKRGRGIASRLVDEARNKLAELGVTHVAAEFPAKNFVAEAFYKKLKFREYSNVYLREV